MLLHTSPYVRYNKTNGATLPYSCRRHLMLGTNARRKSPDKIGAPVYEEDERRQRRRPIGKSREPPKWHYAVNKRGGLY